MVLEKVFHRPVSTKSQTILSTSFRHLLLSRECMAWHNACCQNVVLDDREITHSTSVCISGNSKPALTSTLWNSANNCAVYIFVDEISCFRDGIERAHTQSPQVSRACSPTLKLTPFFNLFSSLCNLFSNLELYIGLIRYLMAQSFLL